ncbi:MAG TPA: hypothetical protein V6D22_13815 [Candidatus Obscuribacterales bacterium]
MYTIQNLARDTNSTVSNIKALIRKGILPHKRVGKNIIFEPQDYFDCKVIMASHVPGTHWVPGKKRPGRSAANQIKRDMTKQSDTLPQVVTDDITDPWLACL